MAAAWEDVDNDLGVLASGDLDSFDFVVGHVPLLCGGIEASLHVVVVANGGDARGQGGLQVLDGDPQLGADTTRAADSGWLIAVFYPPATAPSTMKGSVPVATASGSGASAGSRDRSRPQAK